jgi:hypothetical protein
MKCANHPEVDSVAYCGQCGRALCPECKREVRGIAYCENCLDARLHTTGFASGFGQNFGPQPGLALFLGFIPGVGAIYNGQILKAIIQVIFFGCLIALSERSETPFDTIFGLGAAAFYFYMVIDSYQTARRKQLGQPVSELMGVAELRMNAPVSAVVLIALGVLFLLDNMGVHIFRDIGRFWPLLLIALGVIMLQRKTQIFGNRPPSGSGPANAGFEAKNQHNRMSGEGRESKEL